MSKVRHLMAEWMSSMFVTVKIFKEVFARCIQRRESLKVRLRPFGGTFFLPLTVASSPST